ncbi:MAG: ExbD/TolR family protein [Heliomarina sp.]|uniref:ExbD/TolR family protein n=1 Tax=Heliomarina sp. TaxID=2917556 RepID=UPI004058E771
MSFDLAPAPRRPRAESIVPMINVVFLLLVFFLMTSRLSQPEPFPVTPPTAEQGSDTETSPIIYLSAEGEIAFQELRGEAAIEALSQASEDGIPAPQLRADAGAKASDVARLLRDLSAAGLRDVSLVVAQP